jgi:hypothetical protein
LIALVEDVPFGTGWEPPKPPDWIHQGRKNPIKEHLDPFVQRMKPPTYVPQKSTLEL